MANIAHEWAPQLLSSILRNKFQAWQDTTNQRQKTTKDGVESVIEFVHNMVDPRTVLQNSMYQVYPRIDKWGCRHLEIAGGRGPTRKLLGSEKPELPMILPDLTEERWQLNKSATIEGGPHKGSNGIAYSYSVTDDMGYGQSIATYTFYVTKDGTPLRLFMWGKNLYTGGHFDAYIVDFYDYKPGTVNEDVFSVPDICPAGISPENAMTRREEHWLTRLRSVLPSQHTGDKIYDAFTHYFGRRHSNQVEYQSRSKIFHEARAHIESHNLQAGNSHSLELNKYADWAHEEFMQLMLPNHGKLRPPLFAEGQEINIHKPTLAHEMLPSTVDWRGTGADSPVKDQAMCGSCWAFGAIASVETAFFRKTGSQKLFSEQELMDCAWDEKDQNKGCMGGFQQLAYQWLFPRGGLASEASYPYRGTTDFCWKNATSDLKFSKAKYIVVKGGEQALMEALVTKGPMTVSVDASPTDFVFYKQGIYTQKQCKTKIDDLDHAVIVSGYGSENGTDYWIVKNTWSTNWGDKGYIKINRKEPDCGIATEPIYVEFEVES